MIKGLLSPRLMASATYKVQFFDLDPMHIMWHGNYPKLLETARTELMDICQYDVCDMAGTGYSFPIVQMDIKYIRPITLYQHVTITAGLVEYINRIRVDYVIHDADNNLLTKARTTQLSVNGASRLLELETPSKWQEQVRSLL